MRHQADFVTRESETKLPAKEEVLVLKENYHHKPTTLQYCIIGHGDFLYTLLIALWTNFMRRKKKNEIPDSRFKERSEQSYQSHEKLSRGRAEIKLFLEHASTHI